MIRNDGDSCDFAKRACTTCLQRADMFMSYKRVGKIACTVEVLGSACSCLITIIINWCFGKRNPMNLKLQNVADFRKPLATTVLSLHTAGLSPKIRRLKKSL